MVWTKEQQQAYMQEYIPKKRLERRSLAIKYLGGKCVNCGSTDDLEFDHIDPDSKLINVTTLFTSNGKNIQRELDKCQLLCKKCHLDKTLKESNRSSRFTHGTMASYKHNKCPCDLCKEAARKYRKERKEARNV